MAATYIVVNPRPAGGGNIALLPDFLDSSKTAAYIDAKFSVASPASIWRLPPKFQKNPSINFWENGVLVTSCFAILGEKSKCLKAARMFSFEVRRNQKAPNGVKLKILQNGYLGFLIFLDFDPKNQNFNFSKIMAFNPRRAGAPKLLLYQKLYQKSQFHQKL